MYWTSHAEPGLGREVLHSLFVERECREWACRMASRRLSHQICRVGTLSRPYDGKFYKFLRPSIDHDIPDFDKTTRNIQTTPTNKRGRGWKSRNGPMYP